MDPARRRIQGVRRRAAEARGSTFVLAVCAAFAAPACAESSEPQSDRPLPRVAHERGPTVSLTFDDGYASTHSLAGPVLAAARDEGSGVGMPGTIYVPTDIIGDANRVTWSDLDALAGAGWEVGSHARTHTNLESLEAGSGWSPFIAIDEIWNSALTLRAAGFAAVGFAPPFGAYGGLTTEVAAAQYLYLRPFKDLDGVHGANNWPYNRHTLFAFPVTRWTTPDLLQGQICDRLVQGSCVRDTAGCPAAPTLCAGVCAGGMCDHVWVQCEEGATDCHCPVDIDATVAAGMFDDGGTAGVLDRWVTLVFHDVVTSMSAPTCSPGDDTFYEYARDDLAEVTDFLARLELATGRTMVATPQQTLAPAGTELNPNAQMDTLRGSITPYGGTTARLALDTTGAGVWPDARSSVSLWSDAAAHTYLFMDRINVTESGHYIVEASVNFGTYGVPGTQVTLYVDEWVPSGSGLQWHSYREIGRVTFPASGVRTVQTITGEFVADANTSAVDVYVDLAPVDGVVVNVDNMSIRAL